MLLPYWFTNNPKNYEVVNGIRQFTPAAESRAIQLEANTDEDYDDV
jgi:hypothetical protein